MWGRGDRGGVARDGAGRKGRGGRRRMGWEGKRRVEGRREERKTEANPQSNVQFVKTFPPLI